MQKGLKTRDIIHQILLNIKRDSNKILLKIYNSNILRKGSIFIIHRNSKVKDPLPKEFEILEEKKYGLSKIIFGKF